MVRAHASGFYALAFLGRGARGKGGVTCFYVQLGPYACMCSARRVAVVPSSCWWPTGKISKVSPVFPEAFPLAEGWCCFGTPDVGHTSSNAQSAFDPWYSLVYWDGGWYRLERGPGCGRTRW